MPHDTNQTRQLTNREKVLKQKVEKCTHVAKKKESFFTMKKEKLEEDEGGIWRCSRNIDLPVGMA